MTSSLRAGFGNQLRAVRLARGQTQEQLAEALGVYARYLAGIERGERNLGLDTVDDLAKRLGLQVTMDLDDA